VVFGFCFIGVEELKMLLLSRYESTSYLKGIYLAVLLLISDVPIAYSNENSTFSDKLLDCSFLEEGYFERKNVSQTVIDCLNKGYTIGLSNTSTGNSPLHSIASSSLDGYSLRNIGLRSGSAVIEALTPLHNQNGDTALIAGLKAQKINLPLLVELMGWPESLTTPSKSKDGEKFDYPLHVAIQKFYSDQNIPKNAIFSDRFKVVISLIAMGSDPSTKNSNGEKSWEISNPDPKTGREELISLVASPEMWFENLQSQDMVNIQETNCPNEILSLSFIETQTPKKITKCLIKSINLMEKADDFWSLRNSNLQNLLHIAVQNNADFKKVVAILLAARETGTIKTAISARDSKKLTVLHAAAGAHDDPRTLFALVGAGSDINEMVDENDGWFSSPTGTTAMHIAAKRNQNVEYFIASLVALGADQNIFDNQFREIELQNEKKMVGRLPTDYLNESGTITSLLANSYVKPNISMCQRVNNAKDEATVIIAGFGGLVTGTTALSSTLGLTAVMHSSGALILTGSAGYIGGSLASLGASAVSIFAAPAAIVAAGVSVVALGGAVYVCAGSE
jgi:hypothetical protein